MKLEVKEIVRVDEWKFQLYVNDSACGIYSCEEAAIKAGCKKLLTMKMFDFGQGPVPAHQHPNGGGWVAETAHVSPNVHVGPNAQVYGHAEVRDHVKILEYARVFGNAQIFNNAIIKGCAKIHNGAVISGSVTIGDDIKFSNIKISGDVLIARNL